MTKWTSQLSTWIMTTEHEDTPKPSGTSAPWLPPGAARWDFRYRNRDGEETSIVISFYDAFGNLLDEDEY